MLMKLARLRSKMKLIALLIVIVTLQMVIGLKDVDKEVPNQDIMKILKKILQRLDVMDENYNDMKKTVVSNKKTLFNLELNFRGLEMKLKEVALKTEDEQKQITKNAEAVEELTARNAQLSEFIRTGLHNMSKDVSDIKEVVTEVLPGKSEGRPAKSCSWLTKHSYCARNGNYWVKDGGETSLKYCKMDDHGPVYHNASCLELKKKYPYLKSGTYTITPGNDTFEVVCDMDTDQGGWMMVGKAVVKNETEAKEMDKSKIQQDDYTAVQNVTSGRFLLSTHGLNSLYDIQKFSEIRIDCQKPYHGRRLHIRTNGSEVVEWLLQRRRYRPRPSSCGTFAALPGDSSYLGGDCRRWDAQKWYLNDIYDQPMEAYDYKRKLPFYTTLNYNYGHVLYCDDYRNHANYTNIGSWSFYIR